MRKRKVRENQEKEENPCTVYDGLKATCDDFCRCKKRPEREEKTEEDEKQEKKWRAQTEKKNNRKTIAM